MMKKKRPVTACNGAGLGIGNSVPAISNPSFSATASDFQPSRAVDHISRRFGLPAPTARVVAELAGIGGAP